MMKFPRIIILTIIILLVTATWMLIQAQDVTEIACDAESLAAQRDNLIDKLAALDYEADPDTALAEMFALGAAYQQTAIACGYTPDEAQIDLMVDQTLLFADIGTIIAAQAVGDDIDSILIELETVTGDPFNGQLLYGGIENALDGNPLTCYSCHEVSDIAPATAGTWTRFDEIRSQDDTLEGYTSTRYFVESILHPNAYIVPGYTPNVMPAIYSSRLDIQQLADIIAYLNSQDQLLEE